MSVNLCVYLSVFVGLCLFICLVYLFVCVFISFSLVFSFSVDQGLRVRVCLFLQVEVCDCLDYNRRVIIQGGVGRPLFIALYEEKVYLSSDWGPRKEGRVFVAYLI